VTIQRRSRMCLELSEDEMATLKRLADERGMPRVSLIRQWIRNEAHGHVVVPLSDVAGMERQLRAVFGPQIKRRK
jgi:hypothetical protein